MNQIDIADELNVSQSSVSRDIDFINKQLEAAAKEDIKTRRARELAELDIMENEAAENYYKAKELSEGGRPTNEMYRWLKRC
jgi:predicted transcriptional regulator